jgi:murein DD-endopeptidase MepM/ murein hydrolase activator NlpD
VAIVTIVDPTKPSTWHLSYEDHIGVNGGKADLSYKYSLPIEPGKSCQVGRTYHSPTHNAESGNEYAIDFLLSDRSRVYAARPGEVIALFDSSDSNSIDFQASGFGNFVVIKHSDGSYAEYFHLHRNRIMVKLGDVVRKDQLIALSGNTGYSFEPHLHFCVFYFDNQGKRISVPVLLESASGLVKEPVQGETMTKAP